MMRKRIGVFGVGNELLGLVNLLTSNPKLEIVAFWHPSRSEALAHARAASQELAAQIEPLLTDDLEGFVDQNDLDAVIDCGVLDTRFQDRPNVVGDGLQVVTPLTARLLWGYGVASRDRKTELLRALSEVVESVELTIDSDELFARMLEIAVGVTGAEGGSLMLLDAETRELRIRVAIGIEPELWGKIRVPLGEGIAGRVAADARPVRLRGKADAQAFEIVRERLDVESALSVPLVKNGNVLGVLNVHHATQPDAFSDSDLEFMQHLAELDAQIIARAEEHETLRNQAARYDAVRTVHDLLDRSDPLPERLRALCRHIAGRMGRGIATVYLAGNGDSLELSATSLEGGGLGGEYRVTPGDGIDGRVAQTRQPEFLRTSGGQLAYVALPLLAGERFVGVLAVQVGSDAPRGKAAEEALLEMANAVAEAIAQQGRETRMATLATRVNAINETGIRMISAQQPAEVARLATSSAAMILEADHALLRLQDEDTSRYVIRSYFGSADGPVQEQLFRLDKQVTVDAIKSRSAHLVTDLQTDAALSHLAAGFRSLMATPLRRDGVVIGTLAVYDKMAADRFYAGSFNDEDFQIFGKLISYVERALDNALLHAHSKQRRNFDEQTGLPNASYFRQRVREEIARAAGGDNALAIVVCRIENHDEISRHNPALAHKVTLRTAEALRNHLRDFDVLGRTGDWEFSVLLPEPGPKPGEGVFELARAVADAISKDESLNDPTRVALCFGYAIHPIDGADQDTLFEAAREPRIRMV